MFNYRMHILGTDTAVKIVSDGSCMAVGNIVKYQDGFYKIVYMYAVDIVVSSVVMSTVKEFTPPPLFEEWLQKSGIKPKYEFFKSKKHSGATDEQIEAEWYRIHDLYLFETNQQQEV